LPILINAVITSIHKNTKVTTKHILIRCSTFFLDPKRRKIMKSTAQNSKTDIFLKWYITSRANTTRGLDFEHMIKARAHKGDMRIGKTAKKLDSICCPQCRKTKAGTLKQLRPIGEGDQELEKRLVGEELT
jgi:hypothetical protein